MFLAIIFIVLGLFLLLNALGIIIAVNFWGIFWAIVFLAIGIKMLLRKGKCPICAGCMWGDKLHERMHEGQCCDKDGCECDCDEDECEDGECDCGHDQK